MALLLALHVACQSVGLVFCAVGRFVQFALFVVLSLRLWIRPSAEINGTTVYPDGHRWRASALIGGICGFLSVALTLTSLPEGEGMKGGSAAYKRGNELPHSKSYVCREDRRNEEITAATIPKTPTQNKMARTGGLFRPGIGSKMNRSQGGRGRSAGIGRK
jgi:hypothetical protein